MTPGARPPASSRPLKAVVTDIDGTLTDPDRRLDLTVCAALRELSDRGVPVILATGNVLPFALALQRFLGLRGPLVAENGGLVLHEGGRVERLSRRSVSLRAFRHARRRLPLQLLFTDRWREAEVALEPNVGVRKLAQEVRGLGVRVESTGFALHLMEEGAGKLPALERALEPLGLKVSDCLVAGDGDNDVGMLRAAGAAVSFRDGSARARRAADFLPTRTGGAGLLEALKHYGLLPGDEPRGFLAVASGRQLRALRPTGPPPLHRLRKDDLPRLPRRGRARLRRVHHPRQT